jgi:hypothetical protein
MRHRDPVLILLIGVLAASPGCGNSNAIWVTGKVTKGGAQYAPPSDQLVAITFVAMEIQDEAGQTIKSSETFAAEVDPAGSTFSVPGPDRQGIPPGKYRVAVSQRLKRELFDPTKKQKGKRGDRETDMLANRFAIDTSPITVEVTKSSPDVTVDLDVQTASAKK